MKHQMNYETIPRLQLTAELNLDGVTAQVSHALGQLRLPVDGVETAPRLWFHRARLWGAFVKGKPDVAVWASPPPPKARKDGFRYVRVSLLSDPDALGVRRCQDILFVRTTAGTDEVRRIMSALEAFFGE